MHDLPVHGDGFHGAVSDVEDGSSGRLIHAARFHSDEAVLDDVHPSDSVLRTDLVELHQQPGGSVLAAVDRNRDAFLEVNGDLRGSVRSLFRRDRG